MNPESLMRPSLLLAALLLPTSASAGGTVLSAQVTCEAGPDTPTGFKLLTPEGATCTVVKDAPVENRRELVAPFSLNGDAGTFYAFTCKLPSGRSWAKKLEAQRGKQCVINLTEGGDAGPAPEPAAPAAPKPNAAMAAADLARLVAAIEAEGFSDGKLRTLAMAAKGSYFTIAQLGELLDLFPFAGDKVKAVETVRSHVVDPQNAFELGAHLSFSADKERVGRLFR